MSSQAGWTSQHVLLLLLVQGVRRNGVQQQQQQQGSQTTRSPRRHINFTSVFASLQEGLCPLQQAAEHVMLQVVRRIEVSVRDVKWSEAGELVAIISDASFYVLQYDRDAVEAAAGTAQPEDGIEEAFDLLHEVPETVRTGVCGSCPAWRAAA